MSRLYRQPLLQATTDPIDWEIHTMDDFDLKWAMLTFSQKPADIANVKVWLIDSDDSAYDCVINEVDPNDSLCVLLKCFEGVQGSKTGDRGGAEKADRIKVTYANTEGITIRGKAMVEM